MPGKDQPSAEVIYIPPGEDASRLLDDAEAETDLFALVIDRSEAEAGDWSSQRKLLAAFAATRERVTRWRNRLEIGFTGYDDDPRDLSEIPEVRACVLDLARHWPFAFHFLSLESSFRWTLLYAYAARRVFSRQTNADGNIEFGIDEGGVERFLLHHLAGLRRLQREHHLKDAETIERAAEFIASYQINDQWLALLSHKAARAFETVFHDTTKS